MNYNRNSKKYNLLGDRANDPNVPNSVSNRENSLSELEDKVLALITENPMLTSQNIAEQCDVSRKTVTRVCKLLKEKGIIVPVGKTRGKWIILK